MGGGGRAVLLVALYALAGADAAGAQVLVSVYGGGVHTQPAEVTLEQPGLGTSVTFPEVPFESESLEPPIYYGYRVAVRIPGTPWLFIEGELIHAKLFARGGDALPGAGRLLDADASGIPFNSVFDRFGISHGMNFVLVNALVRRRIEENGRWLLTGRLGAGPMVPHPEIVIDGQSREGYQLGGFGAQLAAGVERELSRHLSVLGDYKFTLSRLDLSVPFGEVGLTARSHHLSLGFGVRF